MKRINIAVLFALVLTAQVYGRPDKYNKSDDYVEDKPQDYDGDDDGDDEVGNKGTLESPPEIRSKPVVLDVKSGSKVELPCSTYNADEYAIQWKKGNTDLYLGEVALTQDNKRIKLGTNNTLKIFNVTEEDSSDEYVCSILSDPVKKIIHTLRVNDPWYGKSIRPWPQKIIQVNENESIRFGCETKFTSPTDIKWSHKGQRLHNGEEVEGNYITIKQASRHNNGLYQCLAEDGSQNPPYESVDVIVNYAPVIEVEHEIVHTGFGMTSELSCKVHGHPRAKITWLKEGEQLTNKKDRKMMNEDKAIRTLLVEHTSKYDLGNYTCVAINSMGQARKDIELTGRPGKPKFIGGKVDDDDSTFTIKWHVESFSPIKQYLLEYRQKGDTEWKEVVPKVNNGKGNIFTVEYPLNNLSSGAYEATLKAQNEFGWSARSQVHTFRKEISTEEPQNVKGLNSNASTTRPFTVLAAVFLVVASCVSISL